MHRRWHGEADRKLFPVRLLRDEHLQGDTAALLSRSRLNIVVGGHVDHGKSTVVGRLLVDTNSLPQGKLEQVRAHCARHARPFEYAFLLDALKDEQAQGITIESARVFFKTAMRDYILIDAPGHIEFLRNLITGAARAEAALLVVDASEGLQENSRRHGYLMSLLGIRRIALIVNKMDLIGYNRRTFDKIAAEFREFLNSAGLELDAVIPVCARDGVNIASRSDEMPWYEGLTVLELLDTFPHEATVTTQAFRMPVQDVYKFTANGDDRRIVVGTVDSGTVRVGMELVFYPSKKRSRVKTFEAFNRRTTGSAGAGEATGFTLTEQVYVARGEVAVRSDEAQPIVSTRFRASVFWMGQNAMVPGREYGLRLGTARTTARLEVVHRIIDASTLSTLEGSTSIARHDVAECTLSLARPVAFDRTEDIAATSRFVLIDGYEISGGGIVRDTLPDTPAAIHERGQDCETESPFGKSAPPAPLTNSILHEPVVIWLTGLSGAGKTTISEYLAGQLTERGMRVEHLDGDKVREMFPSTGFSRAERDAHIKRIGFVASRLEFHGVFVIASFVSPYAEARDFVRSLCQRFIEVHVDTPLEVCEQRDPKGLYQRVRRGEIKQFTGIDDPYEAPVNPELRIDTTSMSVAEATGIILERALRATVA